MFAIVCLALLLGIVGTAALVFAVFIEEAFCLRVSPVHAERGLESLPILSGAGLHGWGKQQALEVATNHAGHIRQGNAAIAMAGAVEQTMSDVVARLFPTGSSRTRGETCSSCRRDVIPVTAPEALAIAEDLSRRCNAKTIKKVCAQARRNAQAASPATENRLPVVSGVCPLFAEGGCCIAHAARPIHCRSRDASDDGKLPAKDLAGNDTGKSFAATLGEGMLSGLVSALHEAHYDEHVYELNSALAAALERPAASQRWSQGEALFAQCATIDIAAS